MQLAAAPIRPRSVGRLRRSLGRGRGWDRGRGLGREQRSLAFGGGTGRRRGETGGGSAILNAVQCQSSAGRIGEAWRGPAERRARHGAGTDVVTGQDDRLGRRRQESEPDEKKPANLFHGVSFQNRPFPRSDVDLPCVPFCRVASFLTSCTAPSAQDFGHTGLVTGAPLELWCRWWCGWWRWRCGGWGGAAPGRPVLLPSRPGAANVVADPGRNTPRSPPAVPESP